MDASVGREKRFNVMLQKCRVSLKEDEYNGEVSPNNDANLLL